MKSQLQLLHRASLDRRSPLRDWLVPPVLFPRFLFLSIVGYVIGACANSLKETAMRYVSFVVAIATLAVVGCADPYYPRSGYSQAYNYPAGYSYPANYSYPAGYYEPLGYGSTGYGYGSTGDYRNYSGTHSGPQVTFTLP